MYLAALGPQNPDVSTYFTGKLGMVGGGGTSRKRNTETQNKLRSKNVRTKNVQLFTETFSQLISDTLGYYLGIIGIVEQLVCKRLDTGLIRLGLCA